MMIDRRDFEAISSTDADDVKTLEVKNLDNPHRAVTCAGLLQILRENCSRWNTTGAMIQVTFVEVAVASSSPATW